MTGPMVSVGAGKTQELSHDGHPYGANTSSDTASSLEPNKKGVVFDSTTAAGDLAQTQIPRFLGPPQFTLSDLRRTRPPPPPTTEYIYQAWVVDNTTNATTTTSSAAARTHNFLSSTSGGSPQPFPVLLSRPKRVVAATNQYEDDLVGAPRPVTGGDDSRWSVGAQGPFIRPATCHTRTMSTKRRPSTTQTGNTLPPLEGVWASLKLDKVAAPDSYDDDDEAEAGGTSSKRAKVKRGEEEGEEDMGIFQRESPRSMKVLRSLLMTFMDDSDNCTLKKRIDLAKFSGLSGKVITNATVHEICVLRPDLVSLTLTNCQMVDDVGLWAIARHATQIHELYMAGCKSFTAMGLRALALRCTALRVLDLSRCTQGDERLVLIECALGQLDDLCLKSLAYCKELTHLYLRDCPLIGDAGALAIIKVSHHLACLDMVNCTGLSNFKDVVLLEVAQSCPLLETLELTGCKYVGNAGLKALAHRACLRVLHLSPCDTLTGKGLRNMARWKASLTRLSLSQASGLTSNDVKVLFSSLPRLTTLELSHCPELTAPALAALCAHATQLKSLDIHNCDKIDDRGLIHLIRAKEHLQNLDISYCPSITIQGLETLVTHWITLLSLNVTGTTTISRSHLVTLGRKLPFAQLAESYLGYEARANAESLKHETESLAQFTCCVIRVQAATRRMLAKARVSIKKREWVIKHRLKKAQALIRGHLARKRFVEAKERLVRHRACMRIQRLYRGYKIRLRYKGIFADLRLMSQRVQGCTDLQRLWRGHRGRKKVQAMRDTIARKMLEEAQIQAAHEVYASRIQKPYRGYMARKRVTRLRAEREAALKEAAKQAKAATSVQKVWRGIWGRAKALARRREMEREVLEWRSACKIQSMWRMILAKKLREKLRLEAEQLKELNACLMLQRAWRGGRGRYLAMIQRKLAKLRNKEERASTTIQRFWRGVAGRQLVREMRAKREVTLRRAFAARKIQKLYRGFKGREAFEVEKALQQAKKDARPLFEKEKLLTEDVGKKRAAMNKYGSGWESLKEDIAKFDMELKMVNESTALYTDSSRIHGMPQRYLTKYLRVQLVRERERQEEILSKLKTKADEATEDTRDLERQLRLVEREINPLVQGVQQKTREDRVKRLRDRIRLEFRSARRIQTIYRGWRLRKALYSWYRDYWVQCMDEATDTPYYYNTWSQDVVWYKPYEMVVSALLLRGTETSSAGLPPGWIRKRDPQVKLPYYWNEGKNEYRWEAPGGGRKGSPPQGAGRGSIAKLYDSAWFDRQNKGELLKKSLKTRLIGLWEERKDTETGVTFYVHPLTQESRWSLPPRTAIADQPTSDAAALMGPTFTPSTSQEGRLGKRRAMSGAPRSKGGKRNRWTPAGGKQLSPEALKKYMPTTPVLAPDERDLEGRRVHRVREYWLEYEAMRNLQILQSFKIPAALFEARMCEVNKHNSRFVPSSIGESAQNFFRQTMDDGEVLCLVIKLSEKAQFRKPSRNILKRWNLSNGMLYLFYSVIGRSHPPTAKEVLEPFYYQKRIDFVRVVCLLPVNNLKGGGTRKRQREAQKVLSPADLEIKAGTEVSDLYGALEKELGPEVSEVAVAEAVEKGVWMCQGAGGDDDDDDDDEDEAPPAGVWRLNVDKVQDWGFNNGALQIFTQACSRQWSVVKPAWDQWNTELGNNAVAWEELWKNPDNDTDDIEGGQNSLGSPSGSHLDDDDSRMEEMPSPQRAGAVYCREVYTPHVDTDDDDDDDDDLDGSDDDEPAHDADTGEPITEAALNLLRLASHA